MASDGISGLYRRGIAELEGIGVAAMTSDEIAAALSGPG